MANQLIQHVLSSNVHHSLEYIRKYTYSDDDIKLLEQIMTFPLTCFINTNLTTGIDNKIALNNVKYYLRLMIAEGQIDRDCFSSTIENTIRAIKASEARHSLIHKPFLDDYENMLVDILFLLNANALENIVTSDSIDVSKTIENDSFLIYILKKYTIAPEYYDFFIKSFSTLINRTMNHMHFNFSKKEMKTLDIMISKYPCALLLMDTKAKIETLAKQQEQLELLFAEKKNKTPNLETINRIRITAAINSDEELLFLIFKRLQALTNVQEYNGDEINKMNNFIIVLYKHIRLNGTDDMTLKSIHDLLALTYETYYQRSIQKDRRNQSYNEKYGKRYRRNVWHKLIEKLTTNIDFLPADEEINLKLINKKRGLTN